MAGDVLLFLEGDPLGTPFPTGRTIYPANLYGFWSGPFVDRPADGRPTPRSGVARPMSIVHGQKVSTLDGDGKVYSTPNDEAAAADLLAGK